MKSDLKAYALYLMFAAVIASIAVFNGCTAFNNMVKSDSLITQLAVEAATARVIHEHPTWKNQAVTVTRGAIDAIDANAVSQLADVSEYVKKSIPWGKLLPEEQAILSVLIDQTVANLTDSFHADGVANTSTQLVEVRQVLVWINQTAARQ